MVHRAMMKQKDSAMSGGFGVGGYFAGMARNQMRRPNRISAP